MPASLSILHTESSCGWGGQELRILQEAQGLGQRGHQVTILCCPGSKLAESAKNLGITCIQLPIYKKRLTALGRLWCWLREHHQHFNLINCHSSTDSWLVALANQFLPTKQRLPIVRTRHVSTRVRVSHANKWLYGVVADRVVTTGEATRQALIQSGLVQPERACSVPTGVDLPVYTNIAARANQHRQILRHKLGIPQQAFVVGCVAMMRDWKGHRYLIESLLHLAHQDVYLLLLGSGEEENKLRDLTQQLGLGKRVIFAGYQRAIAQWFACMDVHCLASYENEGVSQALLQAAAFGLCNIGVAKIAANAEIIQHRNTGLLAQSHQANALASCIEEAIRHPRARKKMGENAANKIRERFALESMLDTMEGLYQQTSNTRQKTKEATRA